MAVKIYLGYPDEIERNWIIRQKTLHTVKFVYINDNDIESEIIIQVKHGSSVTPPDDVLQYVLEGETIKSFTGWDHQLVSILSDVEIHPVYDEVEEAIFDDVTVDGDINAENITTNNLNIGTEE